MNISVSEYHEAQVNIHAYQRMVKVIVIKLLDKDLA